MKLTARDCRLDCLSRSVSPTAGPPEAEPRTAAGAAGTDGRGRDGGFTLLEMIGVLALVMILAALAAPAVLRQIDNGVLTLETANLTAISNAIVVQLVRSNNIPSQATWAQAAANWLTIPVNNVTTTSRHYQRAYLIDPALSIGGGGLPYTQTPAGTPRPTNPRVMVVSSISSPLPVVSGPTNTFNDIWNTATGSKPASWTNWTGDPTSVVIQRINLQPLFHRVVLFDRDTSANASLTFSVNGVATNPASVYWDSYYVDGSVLGEYTNSTPPALLITQIISHDLGGAFDNGSWSDQIGFSPNANAVAVPNSPLSFQDLVYQFILSPYPPSKKGDNTIGVADAFLAYLNAYSSWANMSPCFSYQGNGNDGKVMEYQLMSTVCTCFGGSAWGTCALVP